MEDSAADVVETTEVETATEVVEDASAPEVDEEAGVAEPVEESSVPEPVEESSVPEPVEGSDTESTDRDDVANTDVADIEVVEANDKPDRPVVPRLSVSRLSLPKLSLPKFAGLRAASAVVDAPDKADSAQEDDLASDEVAAEDLPLENETPDEAATDDEDLAQSEAPDVETSSHDEAPAEASEIPSTAVVRAPRASKRVAKKNTESVLLVRGLTKQFDDKLAVAGVDLDVKVGSFYGIVGPNGAGKTTTLSMITGLLRPDSGTVAVHGADVWSDPVVAKRNMGVLPDRLRLFDRLTGAQVLYYAGVLRGLDAVTVRKRTSDLVDAFSLEDELGRLVTDYSAGMMKKIALAAAMIHSPRLLVLDEPFESVDPVSAGNVTEILKTYVKAGGTVVLSSHRMDLVQRICDHVAVIVDGGILADGTMAAVRNGGTLEERFVKLAGGKRSAEGFEWLSTFSD